MKRERKKFDGVFKAKVVVEAIRGEKSVNEIASHYEIHPTQITQWKKKALSELPHRLSRNGEKRQEEKSELIDELYRQIGQLKVELDWVKKNLTGSVEERRGWIEPNHCRLSIARQCELVGLARSSWYYEPQGESDENLEYRRRIDEEYTRHPYYGVRRMTEGLRKEGDEVNPKRVGRRMRVMGLEAIYPKPRWSRGAVEPRKYPYLLGDLTVERSHQAWCTDITYIRLHRGFVYLLAVMDGFSRYVPSWRVSTSMDTGFCLEALNEALEGGRPEIFNSDQGGQFTSREFTGRLEEIGIRISRDGRGRVFDNIFIERLWRSVKYEEVYLKDYTRVSEWGESLRGYFRFYNEERLHQALEYRTPQMVYRIGHRLTA